MVLSSCSNTSPLTKNKGTQTLTQTQLIPTKSPTLVTAVKPVAHIVDWQKIEAAADKKYQDEPLADYYFNILSKEERNGAPWFYAQDFNVSIEEAQRRLLLQGISSPLIEAIAEYLGRAVAAIYYDNNDTDEYSIKVTTLNTVKAVPPKYVYHFKQKEFRNYSFPIYIQASSDKTQEQIFALQEKAWPEILKRYPDTQTIGFSPMTNTINVSIYTKTHNENERQRIENELTELVGHPVKVEFWENRLTTL
ncbi:hypothetical protein ES754_10875 [Psychrobacter frigidicola]|uniref:Uncharacterized protein n=1 Tax=Psychrobacter frigidicola TaxID=45611 RepID=A0A5C7A2W9_9GAMM|nr:hypothetical protein [Psychrobacter frigidicola]TXD96132.1 hypothetical protein ES754_10875 [Psychrobacter frigidicola]